MFIMFPLALQFLLAAILLVSYSRMFCGFSILLYIYCLFLQTFEKFKNINRQKNSDSIHFILLNCTQKNWFTSLLHAYPNWFKVLLHWLLNHTLKLTFETKRKNTDDLNQNWTQIFFHHFSRIIETTYYMWCSLNIHKCWGVLVLCA